MEDIDAIIGVRSAAQAKARATQREIPLKGTRRHERVPDWRRYVDARRAKAAIEALDRLPPDGATWHCIMTGDFDSFDLVDAVIHHARPARVDHLHLATLGFNLNNASRLIDHLHAGRIGTASMLVSMWYESDKREADVVGMLQRELPKHRGWYAATRTHAKIHLYELSDGRCFVIESSANMRTCKCLEQFTITRDRELLAFHRTWMEEARAEAESQTRRRS